MLKICICLKNKNGNWDFLFYNSDIFFTTVRSYLKIRSKIIETWSVKKSEFWLSYSIRVIQRLHFIYQFSFFFQNPFFISSNWDQFPNKPHTFACQTSPQTVSPHPRKLYSVYSSPPAVTYCGHSLRCRLRRMKTQPGALIWHQPLSDCPPWRWMRNNENFSEGIQGHSCWHYNGLCYCNIICTAMKEIRVCNVM